MIAPTFFVRIQKGLMMSCKEKELVESLYGRSDQTWWVAESVRDGYFFDISTWHMRQRTVDDKDAILIVRHNLHVEEIELGERNQPKGESNVTFNDGGSVSSDESWLL